MFRVLLALLVLSHSLAGAQQPALLHEVQEVLVPVAPTESLRVTSAGTGEAVVLLPGLFGGAFGPAAGHRLPTHNKLGVGFGRGAPVPRRILCVLCASAVNYWRPAADNSPPEACLRRCYSMIPYATGSWSSGPETHTRLPASAHSLGEGWTSRWRTRSAVSR